MFKPSEYEGEGESIIEFPLVRVLHKVQGEKGETFKLRAPLDFDNAFKGLRGESGMTPDDAAFAWMVTTKFRVGEKMGFNEMARVQASLLWPLDASFLAIRS